MINVKKKKKNRLIPPIITLILVLIMYFTYKNKYLNDLKIFFNNIGANIENALIIKKEDIKEDISLGINKELLKENSDLKKLLDIKENNYDITTAIVLKRDISWYQTLTINKGKKDGIKKDMAVIDNNGLIGKIIEVGNNYSTVLLITSNQDNIKVAVDIEGIEDYHGILDSYDKENNLIIVNNIDKNSDINIGNKVYTNGLGGVYPSGIYIGDVVSIEYDDLGLAKRIKVETNTNYDNIRYVNIIRR